MTVGVTGHQDIPDRAKSYIRSRLRAAVKKSSAPMTGVSSLAAGADQMFASLVVQSGYELHVIIPCRDYESTFSEPHDLWMFNYLMSQATEKETLPYNEPTEEAFLAAGQRMVDLSDTVLAVWDGKPAKGKGGTADIVDYALRHGKGVVRLWPAGVER